MNRNFGKRGGRGRGSFGGGHGEHKAKKGYLPEELMTHYRRVQESLSQFQDEDVTKLDHSKSEFLNNVVSSLAEELIQVSQNQTVSTIVEAIIAAGSPANLRTLFVACVADLSVTFLDRFASHVLEALVLRLSEFYVQPVHSSPDEEEDDVPQDKVVQSFESLCDFVDSQFETLVTHVYGSHVLRAFLEALSGVPVAHELKKSQKSGHGAHARKDFPQPTQKAKPPEEFKAFFDKYSKRLFRVCDYEVHLKDPLFSLLLQALLMIQHEADPESCHTRCQTILQKITHSWSQCEDYAESIPDMAQDTAGSHLLEVIFKLSGDDLMRETFDSLLQGKLLYYGIHPTGNHVLQTFIASLRDKDLMEKLCEELSRHLEDLLAVGYFGLVTCLAAGCRRLRVRQDEFIMKLMEAFHCKEPQERQKSLMKLIASFTAYEVFFSLEEGKDKPAEGAEEPSLKGQINLHGSRLIQELLQFQKPTHAALGLLDWQASELQLLCCDPAGSHVVDVYFSSPTVIEKNRDIFLRKLKGLLLEVGCSKNGSRCLESVWKHLNLAQRTAIAKELAESERLRTDHFGRFLHRNFQLGLFVSKRKVWQEQQGALAKRKRMMKELLHNTEPAAKKKKIEKPDPSFQRDDHIEDSITALFIKQKQQHDTKRLDSTFPEATSDAENGSEHLSPSSPASSMSEKKLSAKKKKKKKEKTQPEETSPVKLKKKKKVKVEMEASPVKLKKKDKVKVEMEASPVKLKKKDKVKVETASPVSLSESTERVEPFLGLSDYEVVNMEIRGSGKTGSASPPE
ncbi:hypothetical protein ACOMHN_032880 [Nucella lapillus]